MWVFQKSGFDKNSDFEAKGNICGFYSILNFLDNNRLFIDKHMLVSRLFSFWMNLSASYLFQVQRKVSRDQQHHQHQRKQKKSFTSGQASQSPVMSGVRLKWFSAMKGVGSKTLQSSKSDEDISTSDDSTETVVARLVNPCDFSSLWLR